jgi:8-oxo-dGTP pyrophosphatase MutT (NUDIX family)
LPGVLLRLAAAVPNYLTLAWQGLVSPRIGARSPAQVCQAVVLGEQRVLLAVRQDLRGWELPGGHVKPHELHEAALLREVREETGHEIRVERHIGDYVRSGFRPHIASVYACRVTGGALRPSFETPVVRWFDLDDLPDTLFPWFRAPIADAHAVRSEPIVRHTYQGAAEVWAGLKIDLRMRLSNDRAGLPERDEAR